VTFFSLCGGWNGESRPHLFFDLGLASSLPPCRSAVGRTFRAPPGKAAHSPLASTHFGWIWTKDFEWKEVLYVYFMVLDLDTVDKLYIRVK
jgi:hypothetical protein